MFGLVLISAVTLMHVYVFWRAYSVPFLRRHVSGKLFIVSGIALWTVFLLGRFLGHGSMGTLSSIFELLGMNWMAAVFLFTISFLAVDFITAFGFYLKEKEFLDRLCVPIILLVFYIAFSISFC